MAQFIDNAKNFLAEKVAHVKKPEAELTDVDMKNVTREAAEYDAMVSVDNPYSHSLPICEISYTFTSGGRFGFRSIFLHLLALPSSFALL